MSLIPKTPQEILEEYGAELEKIVGPNVLQDPAGGTTERPNRSSNLVRILSMAALSLNDISQKFEAIVLEQNPVNLEGVALTNFAAQRGIYRNLGTKSKTVVMVTGQQGSTLDRGSELFDRFGGKWIIEEDVNLDSIGIGCAFGMGIACSEESGNFCLREDELVYDNSLTPFIFAATNGIMLSIGGAEESDESLRNRIMNRGPLANVKGTADNAIDSLYNIDGVNFARYAFVDTCIGTGPMFIVHGGSDDLICDSLLADSGIACNMVGEQSCSDCTGIRFQRPCPVLLSIEVQITCYCPTQTQQSIRDLIMSLAPSIATQQRVRANDIAVISSEIDSVRFKIRRPTLITTDCSPTVESFNDPIDNTPLPFATNDPFGLCKPQAACTDEQPFVNSININPWQYFIMDSAEITFAACNEVDGDCNSC